jgi:ribose 1,5-bisphosphokinase PhnN
MPRERIVPLQVRMPESVRKQLAAAAKKSGRSMNAEINRRLLRSLAPDLEGELLVQLKDEGLQRRIVEVLRDYVKEGRTIAAVVPGLDPEQEEDS